MSLGTGFLCWCVTALALTTIVERGGRAAIFRGLDDIVGTFAIFIFALPVLGLGTAVLLLHINRHDGKRGVAFLMMAMLTLIVCMVVRMFQVM